MRIEQAIEALTDKTEEVRTAWEEYDEQQAWPEDERSVTVDEVAAGALVALQEALALVRELREAGATIAEAPVEDDALVTCLANAHLIHADMARDVAHLEDVLARVR